MGSPTYTPQTETRHDGGFLVASLPNLTFEQAVLTGSAKIQPGTVLGAKSVGTTFTASALGTNTGNGTFGTVTGVTTQTQIGTYDITFTAATAFTVTAPDGSTATGSTGSAFSGLGLGFTITAGGTAMVAGDGFTLTSVDAAGNPAVTSAAKGTNTGNATMGTITPAGYAPQAGIYRVTFIKANTNLGTFVVEDPQGRPVGHGVVGTAFAGGGISFTIADGATDFIEGDQFQVSVSVGSMKYAPLSLSDATGLAVARAVAYGYTDVSSADKNGTIVARLAAVNASELIWPTGMTAAAKTAALAQLSTQHIIAR